MLIESVIGNLANILVLLSIVILIYFAYLYPFNYFLRIYNLILISELLVFFIFGSDYVNFFLNLFCIVISVYCFIFYSPKTSSVQSVEGIYNSFILNNKIRFGMFSFLGFLLLITVYFIDYYNKILSDTGTILIILSVTLIILDFLELEIRNKYAFEIDFILFFVLNLSLILGFYSVLTFLEIKHGDTFSFLSNEKQVEYLLSIPLANLLNLLGVQSWSDGRLLYYPDLQSGVITAVDITRGCSGIYSIFIFLSCYLSYVFAKIKNLNSKIILFGFFAILLSYFANLIRMIIIVFVGHYHGIEALIWTHKNIGWVIFSLWFLLFWYIFSSYEEQLTFKSLKKQ